MSPRLARRFNPFTTFGLGGATQRRYALTLTISILNALNNINLAPPIAVLGSPLFGRSIALAGGTFQPKSGTPLPIASSAWARLSAFDGDHTSSIMLVAALLPHRPIKMLFAAGAGVAPSGLEDHLANNEFGMAQHGPDRLKGMNGKRFSRTSGPSLVDFVFQIHEKRNFGSTGRAPGCPEVRFTSADSLKVH